MMTSSQLQTLPKVELHRHLEGALRLSTVVETARHMGLEVPKDLSAQKKHFLVTSPMKDLETVLAKFWRSQEILHSEEILTRITYEAIEDAYREGIRILELRYAPTFILENHSFANFDRIHRAIVKGLRQARHLPIAVGLICIIQRTKSHYLAKKVTEFTIGNRDSFIALDLADDESRFSAADFETFTTQARKAGLHITIHAGEINAPRAIQNVREAVDILGAERIGHGVQIYRDSETMDFLKSKGVTLELCPTSNYLTNSVQSTRVHPFRYLMEKGVAVTLNSDDPGIFDYNLTHEYEVLEREQAFTVEEFKILNQHAARASFIPEEQKKKVWNLEQN